MHGACIKIKNMYIEVWNFVYNGRLFASRIALPHRLEAKI
jgi:hypothetical protein